MLGKAQGGKAQGGKALPPSHTLLCSFHIEKHDLLGSTQRRAQSKLSNSKVASKSNAAPLVQPKPT